MKHAPSEHLHLPVANQFIATDLSLKKTAKVVWSILGPFGVLFELIHCLDVCNIGSGYVSSFVEENKLFDVMVQAWYGVLCS